MSNSKRCGPVCSRRLSAPRTGRLYPQECSWYLFSLGAESCPGPWSEGETSLKNPVKPPGIDPRTVRLVAQRLNYYATPGPHEYQYEEKTLKPERTHCFVKSTQKSGIIQDICFIIPSTYTAYTGTLTHVRIESYYAFYTAILWSAVHCKEVIHTKGHVHVRQRSKLRRMQQSGHVAKIGTE
jgi:hypothetical protein